MRTSSGRFKAVGHATVGILVADARSIVREGLKRVLDFVPRTRVAAEARDFSEAVECAANRDVHLVLLDVSMEGGGVLETLRRIKSARPKLPVLALSRFEDDHVAVRVLRAGADGYLTKDQCTRVLPEAVESLLSGDRYVSARLAQRLAAELSTDSAAPGAPPHEQLSDREYQVMDRLCAGRSIKQIAAELGLSPKTVSTYRARVLQKLGLRTNAGLIRYSIERGLV